MLDSLTDAQKFALTALLEVQAPSTVGEFLGETDEGDYVTSYRFATTLPGYPGWNWTVGSFEATVSDQLTSVPGLFFTTSSMVSL